MNKFNEIFKGCLAAIVFGAIIALIAGVSICYNKTPPYVYHSFKGMIYVKSERNGKDAKIFFSKDSVIDSSDGIAFDYGIRNLINIYYLAPDTLYVEGDPDIISTKYFKIIKIDPWPFKLHPRQYNPEIMRLRDNYLSYRDSVLLNRLQHSIIQMNGYSLF